MSPSSDFVPLCIFLFSGKRKAGKDFVTERLLEAVGREEAVIVRLVGHLKKGYAEAYNLDYEKLLSAADYKEVHRKGMVRWAEEMRYTAHFVCPLSGTSQVESRASGDTCSDYVSGVRITAFRFAATPSRFTAPRKNHFPSGSSQTVGEKATLTFSRQNMAAAVGCYGARLSRPKKRGSAGDSSSCRGSTTRAPSANWTMWNDGTMLSRTTASFQFWTC